MSTPRVRLDGLSPSVWEHPADRAALSVLAALPGLAEVLKLMGGLSSDRSLRLAALARAVRSSPLQLPEAHRAVEEACHILDHSPVPEVYVSPGLDYNAYALGFDAPFVVLGAPLLTALSADELLAVAGHEIGHLKAGHALYRTAAWLLARWSAAALPEALVLPVRAALRDWERKSELSCDRAGLLACQNAPAALAALLKTSYPGLADRLEPAELLGQASAWDQGGDLLDSVLKVLALADDSHPPLVLRYAALEAWSRGPDYPAILAGTYRSTAAGDVPDALRAAWQGFRGDLAASKDPGARAAGELLRQAERLAGDLLGR